MLEKILIVDNDRATYEFVQKCISEFSFEYVSTYEDAQHYIENSLVSLIILDYRLQEGKGIETLEKLQYHNPGIGIIISASLPTKAEIIDALESGADAFIEKPINIRVLEKKIQKILVKTHYNIDKSQNTKQKIRSFQNYLDCNAQNKVTLKDISQKNNFSYKYFSRRFKEEVGISFSEYRLEQKIDRAKDLLRKETLSVTQISELLGYMNPSAFMKIFKQKTGFTPSQYRKDHALTPQ